MRKKTFHFSPTGDDEPLKSVLMRACISAAVLLGIATLELRYHALPVLSQRELFGGLVVLALYLVTSLSSINISWRNRVVTIALTDIPLVVAAFTISPWTALATRFICLVVITYTRGASPARTIFNTGAFAFETCAAAFVIRTLQTQPLPDLQNLLWAFVITNVLGVIFTQLIVWHVIWSTRDSFSWGLAAHQTPFLAGLCCAPAAYGTALAVEQNPALSLFLVACLAIAARAMLWRFQFKRRIQILNDFRAETEDVNCTEQQIMESFLRQACRLVDGARGVLVVNPPHCPPENILLDRGKNRGPKYGCELKDEERSAIVATISRDEHHRALIWISASRTDGHSFDDHHMTVMGPLLGHAAARWKTWSLIDQAEFRAAHDPVTGVGNRSYMISQLEKRTSDGLFIAVECRHIAGLTTAFGVNVADNLMSRIAGRFASFPVRYRGAEVARLGDATFGVWLPDGDTQQMHNIINILQKPLAHRGLSVNVQYAVGFTPVTDALTPVDILHQAHTALAKAVGNHSNLPLAFDESDVEQTRQRVVLSEQLHQALAAQDITVSYQPKVDTHNQRVVGMEALARWRHPERGQIAPPVFVELAEQSHQISKLTCFVLEQSLSDCLSWQAISPGVGVAVNISTTFLSTPGCAGTILDLVTRYQFPHHLLTVEVTETDLISDQSTIVSCLTTLRERGIRVAIDDFGTGYSSLSYLRNLPVDEAKIDKSFILGLNHDPVGQQLVIHVASMLKALGIAVVAEGVECDDVSSFLGAHNVNTVQGYAVARAMPMSEATRWLREYNNPLPAIQR